jgi:hypothetical protein
MAFIELADRVLSAAELDDLLATDHPMVERFRLVKQNEQKGVALSFALVIEPKPAVRYRQQRDGHGRRIEPVWQVLTGEERIGQGNRSIRLSGDELVAVNQTFFPNQEFNDLGIGSALYVSLERFYRAVGINQVTLFAVDVGVYVWARQGFAFSEPGTLGENVDGLAALVAREAPGAAFEHGVFTESWDLANYDAAGRAVEGYRMGKYYMLRHAPVWSGIKLLQDERCNAVAEASRRETFSRLPDKVAGATGELRVR